MTVFAVPEEAFGDEIESANDDADSLDFALESRPLGMPEVHVPGSQFGGDSLLQYVREDREQAAKRNASQDKAKQLRPRWRLCFKIDQKPAKQSLGDAWKYSRDFYVTIVDPPTAVTMGKARSPPKSSVFASETACLIADMLSSWSFLALMSNKSYEGKVCLAIGKQCLVGGLVMAMLGAKVIFLCTPPEYPHFQQNIRIFRETLDYTQMKSDFIVVLPVKNHFDLDIQTICELVDASSAVDIILSTEQDLAHIGAISNSEAFGKVTLDAEDEGNKAGEPVEEVQHIQKIFSALAALIPDRAHTAALVICPFNAQGEVLDIVSPAQEWQEKQFCTIADKLKVFLVERTEVEERRPKPSKKGFRKYLAPMGAPSPRCGCGGHPQQSFLNHRIANSAWHDNNEQLKASLQRFNDARKSEQWEDAEECRKWIEAQQMHRKRLARDGKKLYRQSLHADKMKVPQSPRNMYGHQVPALSGFGFSAMLSEERSISETPSISEEPGTFPRTRLATPRTPKTGKDGRKRATSTLAQHTGRNQASPRIEAASPPAGHIADARPNTAPEGATRGSRGSRFDHSGDRGLGLSGLGETSLQESSVIEAPAGKMSASVMSKYSTSLMSSSKFGSTISSTISGQSIHERHANPPFWYRCNRVPYGTGAKK
jgi:hypothetical protein